MDISQKKVLTMDEACDLIGLKKSYVYKLTSAGILPFSKPTGRRIYFDREKLVDWMLSNPNTTLAERTEIAATYVTTYNQIKYLAEINLYSLTEQDIKDFRQLRQQLSPLFNKEQLALLARIQSGIGASDKKPAPKVRKLTPQQEHQRKVALFL